MKKNFKKRPDMAARPRPVDQIENSEAVDSETVVIYDECGDSMWDRVLTQNGQINGSHELLPGK